MFFDFNGFSGPLLLGFVQGIAYAGMLLWRGAKRSRLSDRLLALILIVCCLHVSHYMLGFAGWFQANDVRTALMFYFPVHNLYLLGPLIWFYFRSLTNVEFQFGRRDLWHWLPGALYLLLYLAMFAYDKVYLQRILGEELCDHHGIQGPFSSYIRYDIPELFEITYSISIFVYLILTLRTYRRYRRYVLDNFSDTEGIEFTWLRNLLYLLLAGIILGWALNFYGYLIASVESFFVETWDSYLVISIMIYILSIVGYSATQSLPALSFEAARPQSREETPAIEAAKVPNELEEWKGRLLKLMQEERPYLEADLTLTNLAKRLHTNPSTLSKVINTGFAQNFNDFVNSRRVEAVKAKLQGPDSERLTLLAIANDCGFNSKATFNRAFRKFTGMSPREYLGETKD
ncbi:MAG: helix-turn-helix domain-containing protein [Bacteroidota bacterium]